MNNLKKQFDTWEGKLYVIGSIIGSFSCILLIYDAINTLNKKETVKVEQILLPLILTVAFVCKMPYLRSKILSFIVLGIWSIFYFIAFIIYLVAYFN